VSTYEHIFIRWWVGMAVGTRFQAIERQVLPGTGSMSTGPVDPGDRGVERVADMFKLLGDPTRCRILFALLESPDLRVFDIATATATTQTTVSAALRLLRTAGVVVGRRDGRTVHYRVADEHVAKLLTVSWQHSSHPGLDDEEAADEGVASGAPAVVSR
jgi:ArsR family transcriptional regulator, lead/cadmium/zinc/bismuth-responsive transcriptional repressor